MKPAPLPRSISRTIRVLLLIGVMAAASFLVGAAVYAIASSQNGAISTDSDALDRLRGDAQTMDGAIADQHAALDEYVLSRDTPAVDRFHAAVTEETTAFQSAQAEATHPAVQTSLVALETVAAGWRERVATPVIAAVQHQDEAALRTFATTVSNDEDGLDAALAVVDRELDRADTGLAQRAADASTVSAVGAGVAFGFLVVAFLVAILLVRRYGRRLESDASQASVLNRFTEVTSFAIEERDVAATNLVALRRLVSPDASVIHILNRSMDRAVPEASMGDATAEVLPLHRLNLCAGIARGSMYVSEDLSDDLAVRCPIYPAGSGTLACIPLISGESVGSVHLHWRRPNAFPLALRSNVARISEHAALAIGNRRLLAALHGQANTDARTGLANSRAFDKTVEDHLAAMTNGETVAVLMLDIDHFKLFNDRHGHPAGDDALRAFAGVLRSCMRDGDLAARYGGEEFAVLLPDNSLDEAMAVAERIRSRTESTIIALPAGQTARMTVSIGVAVAPSQANDRVALLRAADEALYAAKNNGRNQVVSTDGEGQSGTARNRARGTRIKAAGA